MADKITEDAIKEEINNMKEGLDNKFTESQILDIIQSNEFMFVFEDIKYKLKKPSTYELMEMYSETAKKKTHMLLNSELLPASILRKKWKERGIDIDEIENQIKLLIDERDKINNSLGKLLEETEVEIDKEKAEKYKKNVLEINKKIGIHNQEINSFLDVSLENQLGVFQYMYLAYLITEKEVDGNFVKAFDSFDAYNKASGELTNRLNIYTVLMTKDVISGI